MKALRRAETIIAGTLARRGHHWTRWSYLRAVCDANGVSWWWRTVALARLHWRGHVQSREAPGGSYLRWTA